MQHSESLLTEILKLLQELNSSVHDFSLKLKVLEGDFTDFKTRFDGFVDTAFGLELIARHKADHEKIANKGIIRRFLRYLDRKLG